MYKRQLVFAAACMGMLLFGIELITLGSVVPDLRMKFQLDEVTAGTLFSILPFGILVGSVAFGPIADRYGYKWLLVISLLGFFIGFEGIAFSSTLGMVKFFDFIIGLFGGVVNGAVNAVVADISVSKGANLSLLGVFFGIGALGMPFVLGLLRESYPFEKILQYTGLLIAVTCVFYSVIHFPSSKKDTAGGVSSSKQLFREWLLILIGLFLFCQSSYEALINNWTTTYLSNHFSIGKEKSLFALSLYVTGFTIMRLLTGSLFRSVRSRNILLLSFVLLLVGNVLLKTGPGYGVLITGLMLTGMGLAGGFPIMLGIVGDQYPAKLGTAFSFVLLFALTGNILLNYVMGIVAEQRGVAILTTITFIEFAVMIFLFFIIFRLRNIHEQKTTTNQSTNQQIN